MSDDVFRIETGRLAAGATAFVAAVLAVALFVGSSPVRGEDDSLTSGAKKAGHAVGSTAREIGQGFKEVGKTIGQGAKKAGKAVGNAAKEGGKAVKRGIKGEE